MMPTIPCITATVAPEAVDALLELIDSSACTPTAWHDIETGECRLDIFPSDGTQVAASERALLAAAKLLDVTVVPQLNHIAPDEWAESWKRFFKVEHISPRLVVRPSWEHYTPAPDERVITLDPGLSFGTGKHATTRACLMLLDRLAAENPDRPLLDMGCGSGILAIAALLLGFREVRAFDNDPQCLEVAHENAVLNGVTLPLYLADLQKPHPAAQVVVANILAPVLIEFAPQVAASLAPHHAARLILSGILDSQYVAVHAAYQAQGLQELDTLLLGEWRTGLFGHKK